MGLFIMEKEITNIILGQEGPADCFVITFGWFKFKLKIKPLTVRQLIKISGELSQVRAVDESKDVFPALMEGITDTRYIAKVIAIATGTYFQRIVTSAILRLPLKDVNTLFSIVQKQSDPSPFFFICLKAGKMNQMKKVEKQ